MPWYEDLEGLSMPTIDQKHTNPLDSKTWSVPPVTALPLPERDQSMKKDSGKPRMELIDWGFIEETAKVLGFGAAKYEEHGWRKGMKVSRVIGSLFRHAIAFAMGQDKDPESGLSHLGHVGCNLMFLVAYMRDNPALDDRVKVMS